MEFTEILKKTAEKIGIPSYKSGQVECLEAIYKDKDVAAVLPTGYGKSAIFQSLPYMFGLRDGSSIETDRIVVVITPLNAIMMDQCRQLCDKGIKAAYLDYKATTAMHYEPDDDSDEGDDADESGRIVSSVSTDELCGFNILYAHPESVLCKQGRSVMLKLKKQICAIAVDEAHIVLEW